MKFNAFLLAALAFSTIAHASIDIVINQPYARATPPNAVTSAVFLQLINNAEQDRKLVAAKTPAAKKVELHDVIHDGDIMKMRKIESINLPAQSQVSLKPGNKHIMLFDLTKPLVEGENIKIELLFANGEKQTIQAPIKHVMGGMKHHQ